MVYLGVTAVLLFLAAYADTAPIPGCTSVASSIHAKTCADVLMHAGPSGAKALMLLNPDLDCSTAIEPNTPVCIAAQGYGTTLLDVLVRDYYMYFINDDMQTQSDATAACKGLAGDLVSIHNSGENSAVLEFGSKFLDRVPMFFGDRLKLAWLGVEVQTSGAITNTDGSYVGWEGWSGMHRPGAGNAQQCAHINMTNGEWSTNVNCGSRLFYMCKRLVTPTIADIASTGWNVSGVPSAEIMATRDASINAQYQAQEQKKKTIGISVGLVVTLLVLLVAALFVFRYRHQLRHRYQEFKDGGATDTRQGSMGLLKGSLLSASAGMDRAGSMLARLRSRNASRSGSMGMSDSAQGYGDSMQADLEMPGPRGARPLMADASTNTRISIPPGYAANKM